MPPFLPIMIAAAGLYVGARWVSREMLRRAEEARAAAEEVARRAAAGAASVPRDLGVLEYDAQSGVYRPKA